MSDEIEVHKRTELLKDKIRQAEKVLVESLENLNSNQDSYSARLLVASAENYLSDLLVELQKHQNVTGATGKSDKNFSKPAP